MAKQYYIKKNPSVDGPSVEWIAINGKEFYQLITFPAGKGGVSGLAQGEKSSKLSVCTGIRFSNAVLAQ